MVRRGSAIRQLDRRAARRWVALQDAGCVCTRGKSWSYRQHPEFAYFPFLLYQKSVQQNGSWYIHVFCVKSGFSLDPKDEDYSSNAVAYSVKRMNGPECPT